MEVMDIVTILKSNNIFAKIVCVILTAIAILWIVYSEKMSPHWRNVVSITYGATGIITGVIIFGLPITVIMTAIIFLGEMIESHCDKNWRWYSQNVTALQELLMIIGHAFLIAMILRVLG